MIPLNTVSDVKDIVNINDATIQGILICFCIICIGAIIYLYKNTQVLHREFREELKSNNKLLIEMNNNNNEAIKSLREMFNHFYK